MYPTNPTDEYLIACRAQDNRILKKWFLKCQKLIYRRAQNPIDRIKYPDPMSEELLKLSYLVLRFMDWVDKHPNGMQRTYNQLEFNWVDPHNEKKEEILMTIENDSLPYPYCKPLPCDYESQTREQIVEEALNDIWTRFYKVHEDTKKTDNIKALHSELLMIIKYITPLIEGEDYRLRVAIKEVIVDFIKELIDFIAVHYEKNKNFLCASLYTARNKLETHLTTLRIKK